jgi:hypothetical protein
MFCARSILVIATCTLLLNGCEPGRSPIRDSGPRDHSISQDARGRDLVLPDGPADGTDATSAEKDASLEDAGPPLDARIADAPASPDTRAADALARDAKQPTSDLRASPDTGSLADVSLDKRDARSIGKDSGFSPPDAWGWVKDYRLPDGAAPACTTADIDPLLRCVQRNCPILSSVIPCALQTCNSEILALPKDCRSCILSLATGDVKTIVNSCVIGS